MKKYKQQFLSFFLILLLSNFLFSQEKGQWSEWEEFPVFKGVKTKYKFKPEGDFYKLEIQCSNKFKHDLVVMLQLKKSNGRTSMLKLNVPPTLREPYATEILVSQKPENLKNFQAYMKPHWDLLNVL